MTAGHKAATKKTATAPQRHRPVRERISKQLRNAVYTRDGGVCQLCGKVVSLFLFHIDHRKPVAHGGSTVLGNLRLACSTCNQRRGTGTHNGRRYA